MRSRHAAAAVVFLLSASCSSEPFVPPTRVAVPIESTTFAPSLAVDLGASTRTASGLYYRDLTTGTGATLSRGQQVGVYYVGRFSNGEMFDSRQPPADPFSFLLGAGRVIEGWDEGVAGMRIGGRRQLIVPPSLGYGSEDRGPIPGNSVLVFTVEAVSAR